IRLLCLGATSLVKDSLAAITFCAVRKNRDDALSRTEPFGDLVRGVRSGPRRPAAEQTFESCNLLQRRANLVVLDHHDLIRQRSVKDRRNEIALADAFNFLWSRWSAAVNRSFGLDQYAKHFAILFSH